jgi:hypothetical protein
MRSEISLDDGDHKEFTFDEIIYLSGQRSDPDGTLDMQWLSCERDDDRLDNRALRWIAPESKAKDVSISWRQNNRIIQHLLHSVAIKST